MLNQCPVTTIVPFKDIEGNILCIHEVMAQ